ncbi:hypothetical protein KF707_14435 [Candidatus Obscuribacterales bacterium]|nr:hypothetical protein [Candidatus Obscuribacterales bacterium]
MKTAVHQRSFSTSGNGSGPITDERFSPRSVVLAIAGTGLVLGSIAILFGFGLIIQKNFSSFASAQASKVDLQKRAEARIDEALKGGHLIVARTELEKLEDAYGLSPEYSVKLDRVYLSLSKQSRAHGDNASAVKLLNLIPSESPEYKTAQHELGLIRASGKHRKKAHGKWHPRTKANSRSHHG